MAPELSWSPERGPEPGPGLCAVALRLLLPLACGLGPLCCFRRLRAGTEAQSAVLRLLSSMAGGVLLGTALLDALPSALSSISAALEALGLSPRFPIAAFVLSLGFLLLPLLEPPRAPPPAPRAAALLLALGLREAAAAPGPGPCPARLLHSAAVASSAALRLLRGGLRGAALAASLLPLCAGAALGAALGAGAGPRLGLARAVVRGLAAGALLRVTAREAPPRDPRLRAPGALLLLAGFALVCGLLLGRA